MADAEDPDDATSVTYADALTELRAILDELEHEDIDVDRLAERVARAAALVDTCRARIASARVEVSRIVLDVGDENGSE
jgi:exodeoxyribonuclease VII small subunit